MKPHIITPAYGTLIHDVVYENIARTLGGTRLRIFSPLHDQGFFKRGVAKVVGFSVFLHMLIGALCKCDHRYYKFKGVNIGFSLNDTIIRNSESGDFSFGFQTFNRVCDAIRCIYAYTDLFDKGRIAVVVGGTEQYIYFSIVCQLAAKYGVPAYTLKQLPGEILGCFEFNPQTLVALPDFRKVVPPYNIDSESHLMGVQENLNKRMIGNRSSLGVFVNPRTTQVGFTNKFKSAFWLFCHDFYDCPGMYGINLFRSHVQWLKCILQICKQENLKLVVKAHPNQREKSSFLFSKLCDQLANYGAIWTRDDFTINQIKQLDAIGIITVYGSVIPEAALAGIPVLSCGNSPFSFADFVIVPKSRKDLRNNLRDLSKGLKVKNTNFNSVIRAEYMVRQLLEGGGRSFCLPVDDMSEGTFKKVYGNHAKYPANAEERQKLIHHCGIARDYVLRALEGVDLPKTLGITLAKRL